MFDASLSHSCALQIGRNLLSGAVKLYLAKSGAPVNISQLENERYHFLKVQVNLEYPSCMKSPTAVKDELYECVPFYFVKAFLASDYSGHRTSHGQAIRLSWNDSRGDLKCVV